MCINLTIPKCYTAFFLLFKRLLFPLWQFCFEVFGQITQYSESSCHGGGFSMAKTINISPFEKRHTIKILYSGLFILKIHVNNSGNFYFLGGFCVLPSSYPCIRCQVFMEWDVHTHYTCTQVFIAWLQWPSTPQLFIYGNSFQNAHCISETLQFSSCKLEF